MPNSDPKPLYRSLYLSTFMLVCVTQCGDDELVDADDPPEVGPPEHLEKVVDPKTCESCHPKHYRDWLGSMHAYAAEDPVFLAMNQRYLRETGDTDPDFCVGCHAPLALEFNYTKDGLNLASNAVPQWAKGVTCYFCHNTSAIAGEAEANNPLVLERSTTMYGSFADAMPAVPFSGGPAVHASARSPLHDGENLRSSALCGSCHDVVTPHGIHLERTYQEWQGSIYADPMPVGLGNNACGNSGCHMRNVGLTKYPVSENSPGVLPRWRRSHSMVGVDVALTNFPDDVLGPQLQAEQRAKISELRDNAVCSSICVLEQPETGTVRLSVWLHNEGAGHSWPSGATQDRRAWAELSAYKDGQEVFGFGHVGQDEAVVDVLDENPDNWGFFDRIYDEAGHEVHMFWDARSYVSTILPVNNRDADDPESSSWRERVYTLPYDSIDRVELSVHIRPMAREVLEDLVISGDLDSSFVDSIETFDVPLAHIIWPTEETIAEPLARTFIYSDTGHGTCVASSQSCRSPFICENNRPAGCRQPPDQSPP